MFKKTALSFSILLVFVLTIYSCSERTEKQTVPADQSLAMIKEKGKIEVGVNFPYGIMEFFDEQGVPQGIDIDIVREIAKRMNLELDIIDSSWDALFEDVQRGRFDLGISSITITPERQEKMLFSIPYLNSGQTIIVMKDNTIIKSAADLNGKKVGAQKDTTCMEAASEHAINPPPIGYAEYKDTETESIFTDLKEGKLDAVVMGYTGALGQIRDNPNLKIVGEPLTNTYRGIVTKLGNNTFMDAVNTVLREMKRDGTLNRIVNKWKSQ